MPLFGKRRADAGPAIDQFWQWWHAQGARQASAAVGETPDPALVTELTERVVAIRPGLAWELAPGSASAQLLIVTADGDPDLRATARRWLRAAPEADVVWSYADSRQPVADIAGRTLNVDGGEIALDRALVGVRRQTTRVDVTFYHPGFADLPEQQRLSVCFLALDAAIGEEATETWIGELTPATHPPIDGFGLAGLRAVVRDLKAEHLDVDGEPAWMELRGQGRKGAVSGGAQVPLAAAWAPQLNSHVSIAVPYADRDEAGLPGPAATEALRSLQRHVTERMEGAGRVVAFESSAGLHVMHAYVEGDSHAAEQIRAAVRGWPDGQVTVAVEDDPGWSGVAHLRG
ncbi:DUF695 domain-containing protein [Rudaeicoccus suwonensis]|uniref:Uncharacterized protein DUF695 n=1 Tax=Rudaeicoccus suwonensis TaxID=657409 RepID=A0A561EAH5_9MICO|nr:DUF695 domain-containing protein [Rudaeicoccus suwonensis]TWE12612.1 uncharacterized protein DUF695 [Rudaeicoccus suwonensis]